MENTVPPVQPPATSLSQLLAQSLPGNIPLLFVLDPLIKKTEVTIRKWWISEHVPQGVDKLDDIDWTSYCDLIRQAIAKLELNDATDHLPERIATVVISAYLSQHFSDDDSHWSIFKKQLPWYLPIAIAQTANFGADVYLFAVVNQSPQAAVPAATIIFDAVSIAMAGLPFMVSFFEISASVKHSPNLYIRAALALWAAYVPLSFLNNFILYWPATLLTTDPEVRELVAEGMWNHNTHFVPQAFMMQAAAEHLLNAMNLQGHISTRTRTITSFSAVALRWLVVYLAAEPLILSQSDPSDAILGMSKLRIYSSLTLLTTVLSSVMFNAWRSGNLSLIPSKQWQEVARLMWDNAKLGGSAALSEMGPSVLGNAVWYFIGAKALTARELEAHSVIYPWVIAYLVFSGMPSRVTGNIIGSEFIKRLQSKSLQRLLTNQLALTSVVAAVLVTALTLSAKQFAEIYQTQDEVTGELNPDVLDEGNWLSATLGMAGMVFSLSIEGVMRGLSMRLQLAMINVFCFSLLFAAAIGMQETKEASLNNFYWALFATQMVNLVVTLFYTYVKASVNEPKLRDFKLMCEEELMRTLKKIMSPKSQDKEDKIVELEEVTVDRAEQATVGLPTRCEAEPSSFINRSLSYTQAMLFWKKEEVPSTRTSPEQAADTQVDLDITKCK